MEQDKIDKLKKWMEDNDVSTGINIDEDYCFLFSVFFTLFFNLEGFIVTVSTEALCANIFPLQSYIIPLLGLIILLVVCCLLKILKIKSKKKKMRKNC